MSLLLSGSLLALGACGDDSSPPGTGDESGTTTGNGTTGPSMTTNESVDTTAGPGPGTTTDDPTTTGVDTTAGEEESTTGDDTTTDDTEGSTGDPVGCEAGMSFSTLTSVDNDMITNLDVSGLVSCNMDITITVTGGTICAVDDGAGGYYYTVETLAIADVPPMQCGLAQVGLTNVSIEDIGDGMEVVVDQAGGTVTGNQSITVNGDVEGTAIGMNIMAPLMDFNGNLPEGDVEFGAGDTTTTYADDMTVIATAMPEVSPGVVVTVTLTGLDGTFTLAQ